MNRKDLELTLRRIYAVFPVLNRPMALSAAVAAVCVVLVFYKSSLIFLLLLLFFVSAIIYFIRTRKIKVALIALFLFAVSLSAFNEIKTVNELEYLNGETVLADFIAVEDSKFTGNSSSVAVYCYNAEYMPKRTKFNMVFNSDYKVLCGDRFSAIVKLRGLEDSDYKMYNFGNSVYMSCYAVKVCDTYSPDKFFAFAGNIRRGAIRIIKENFGDDISALLIALTCGDRSYMSAEFYNKAIVCGVIHVMVVSGLHISIILGSVFSLCERLFYNRFIKAFSAVTAVILICAVCGFTLSVVRAGFMFVFMAVSPLFKRVNDSFNSLGTAVTLMLIISPFCIFSGAFLLSVSSTLAVVWFAPFVYNLILERLPSKNTVLRQAVEVFIVSMCAMIFTAPVAIKVFGKISLLSPLVFLLITFPVTYALRFNTVALAVSFLKYLPVPLFFVSGICARYIYFVIDTFGEFDFLVYNANNADFIISVLLIFVLVVLMYIYKYFLKMKALGLLKRGELSARNI